jgi:hypothetical protein
VNTGDELSVRCEYEWQAVGSLGMPVARAIGGYRSNRRGKRIRRLLQEKGTEMSTRPWDWNRKNDDRRKNDADDRRKCGRR